MPKRHSRVRLPIFLDHPVLRRVDLLVAEFNSSRSAVIRVAVDRGLPAAGRQLRAAHKDRLRDLGATSAAPSPVREPAGPLTLEEAVGRLRVFGAGVMIGGVRPAAETLRDILQAHANTLPILADDFDDALEEALAAVLSTDEDSTAVPLVGDPNRPPE